MFTAQTYNSTHNPKGIINNNTSYEFHQAMDIAFHSK